MATFNAPYGGFLHTGLSYKELGAGLTTQFGSLLPPGGRVAAYVSSTGARDYDSQDILAKTVPTLAAALRHCRSGRGDIVYVMPGHTENVTDATMLDNLVAGTRIIGAGNPGQDDAPTFTWTATASEWTLDQKNVEISGLRLDFTGVDAVVTAISVTAADCSLTGCHIITSSAAEQPTLCIDVEDTGDGFKLLGCVSEGTADVAGALVSVSAADKVHFSGNRCQGGHTAAVGFLAITDAATRLEVHGNVMSNTAAASTATISISDDASSGLMSGNHSACISGGVSAAEGILIAGTTSILRFSENYNTSDPRASGILNPAVAT